MKASAKKILRLLAVLFAVGGCLCELEATAQQQGALVPFNPSPRVDKQGNEWNLEQNGVLNRPNSGGNSIINNIATLQIGNQQFYTNQPMATPDGREMVIPGAQPMLGVSITRRIRYLEKEGGLRYIETFTNSMSRDASITVEVRHNFNGQVRGFLTDRGRPNNGVLNDDESGIIVLPGQGNTGAPSLLLTVCAPRSKDRPRIATRSQYQLSFFHSLVIPGGKSVSIMHTIGQAKTGITPGEDELAKLFRPLSLARMIRDVPRDIVPTLANIRRSHGVEGIEDWLPTEIWGVRPETFDVLAVGDSSRLKGRAQCARLELKHEFGDVVIPWEEVAALAGAKYCGHGRACVWLKDGEVLAGQAAAADLRFTMVSGLTMDLTLEELDRLVMSNAGDGHEWPEGITALIETWKGERFALAETGGEWRMDSVWGEWRLNARDIVMFSAPGEGSLSGLARLRNGSQARLMASNDQVTLRIKRFGEKPMSLTDIRQAVTEEAFKVAEDEEGDPAESFVELAGEQRLVCRLTSDKVRLATSGGMVELSPSSIRELRDVTDEQDSEGPLMGRWYQVDVWGGGVVFGQMTESIMRLEGQGFAWNVPVKYLTRLVNPVPRIESGVMARVGLLIKDLGSEQWKTREKASAELRELGLLAKPGLQEAMKGATDAEVIRRIEELMQEID